MPSTRKQVYAAIDGERDYQDTLNADTLALGEELALITKYAGSALAAWSNRPFDKTEKKARGQLRKLAALCVRALEHHGVDPRPSKRTLRKAPAPAPTTTAPDKRKYRL